MKRRAKHARVERRENIVLAFVRVTDGEPVRDLGELLRAMRKVIPDVTENELRGAIAQTLREGRRKGNRLAAAARRGCQR